MNKKEPIIWVIIFLIFVFALVWLLKGLPNFSYSKTATSISAIGGDPCSVTTSGQSGGTNAPCSNQEATYSWTNHDGWSAEQIAAGVDGNGVAVSVWSTYLAFQSSNALVPRVSCLHVTSDAPMIEAFQIPYHGGGEWGKNPVYNFTLCGPDIGTAPSFKISFSKKPSNIEASLSRGEIGPNSLTEWDYTTK